MAHNYKYTQLAASSEEPQLTDQNELDILQTYIISVIISDWDMEYGPGDVLKTFKVPLSYLRRLGDEDGIEAFLNKVGDVLLAIVKNLSVWNLEPTTATTILRVKSEYCLDLDSPDAPLVLRIGILEVFPGDDISDYYIAISED